MTAELYVTCIFRHVVDGPCPEPAEAGNVYCHAHALRSHVNAIVEDLERIGVVTVVPDRCYYVPDLFSPGESLRIRREVEASTEWHQMVLNVGDSGTPLPRLVSWHADPGIGYRYSGITHTPADWTAPLLEVRGRVQLALGESFNGVLLNLYRDGRDSIGRHADREDDLVPGAPIVGVSLGAERTIRLRRNGRGRTELIDLPLADGSMLVMCGDMQRTWTHEIRKTDVPTGERLSLTFRRVRT